MVSGGWRFSGLARILLGGAPGFQFVAMSEARVVIAEARCCPSCAL